MKKILSVISVIFPVLLAPSPSCALVTAVGPGTHGFREDEGVVSGVLYSKKTDVGNFQTGMRFSGYITTETGNIGPKKISWALSISHPWGADYYAKGKMTYECGGTIIRTQTANIPVWAGQIHMSTIVEPIILGAISGSECTVTLSTDHPSNDVPLLRVRLTKNLSVAVVKWSGPTSMSGTVKNAYGSTTGVMGMGSFSFRDAHGAAVPVVLRLKSFNSECKITTAGNGLSCNGLQINFYDNGSGAYDLREKYINTGSMPVRFTATIDGRGDVSGGQRVVNTVWEVTLQ